MKELMLAQNNWMINETIDNINIVDSYGTLILIKALKS
jgi:hypothetical protein